MGPSTDTANEERLARAQQMAHLGSWDLDLVRNELTWSDEIYRIFGLQPREFAATYEAFLAHVHPEDREAVDAAYSGSLRENRDGYEIDHRIVRKATGEIRWVHEKCRHLRDETGRLVASQGMVLDITERKQAEEALRESEQRVRKKLLSVLSPEGDIADLELGDVIDAPAIQSLLEDFHALAGIPVSIIDLKGKILVGVGWQDICTRFHRVHAETSRNCLASDLELSIDVPPGKVKLYKCKNGMWDVVTPLLLAGRKVGNLFSGQFFLEGETPDREWFRAQAARHGFNEADYLAALDRVPRLSRTALDTGMSFFVKLADMLSALSYANIKLARLLTERDRGLKRFELLADTASVLLRTPDPARSAEALCLRVMEHLQCQVFFNFLVTGKRLHLNACAGIPAEEARRIEWLDYGVAVCGCVARDGCRIVAEHIPSTPDPRTELVKSYGIRAYACHPLTRPGGAVIGTLSFGTRDRDTFGPDDLVLMKAVADLVATAMNRMQGEEALHRTLEELARSNTELEQFASISSHDLQEPLRMISAFAGMLKDHYGDNLDSTAGQYIGFIVEGATRMQNLVGDLLDYSRVGAKPRELTETKVDESLDQALVYLKKAIEESGAGITRDPLPLVTADGAQLTQLFQNLISNAIKYRKPGSRPEIHIGAERVAGDWRFVVRDNGIGIDPRYADRIFEIFQRLHTREEFAGTGIGLAICRKIVDRHGGRIWVESTPGVGSTFLFTLPASRFIA